MHYPTIPLQNPFSERGKSPFRKGIFQHPTNHHIWVLKPVSIALHSSNSWIRLIVAVRSRCWGFVSLLVVNLVVFVLIGVCLLNANSQIWLLEWTRWWVRETCHHISIMSFLLFNGLWILCCKQSCLMFSSGEVMATWYTVYTAQQLFEYKLVKPVPVQQKHYQISKPDCTEFHQRTSNFFYVHFWKLLFEIWNSADQEQWK